MGGPGGGVVVFQRQVGSVEMWHQVPGKQFTASLGRLPGLKIIGKAQKIAEPARRRLNPLDLLNRLVSFAPQQ